MSYIPKYILKRMIPQDAVKAVKGGIEMTIVNVISPISIDEMPENVLDYIGAKIDSAELSKDVLKGIKLSTAEKTFSLANIKELVGVTVPVGATIKIFLPATNLKKGETHTIDVTIKTNNPINIAAERTIM
jgi:hypothetical protein